MMYFRGSKESIQNRVPGITTSSMPLLFHRIGVPKLPLASGRGVSGDGCNCARRGRPARFGSSATAGGIGNFSGFRFRVLPLHGYERFAAGSSPAFTELDGFHGSNRRNRLYRRCGSTDWQMTYAFLWQGFDEWLT